MARTPIFSSIVINTVDRTADIRARINNFSYSDIWGAAASHFEFELYTKDQYSTSIYIPKIGDYIRMKFKYAETSAVSEIDTGTMRIDDLVLRHDIPVYSLGASAYDYAKIVQPVSYTNATIRAIVDTQATQLGLTVFPGLSSIASVTAGTSSASGDAKVEKAASRGEILALLARKYGYAFTLYLGQIIFYDIDALEKQPSVRSLTKTDVCSDSSPQSRRTVDGNTKTVRVAHNSNSSESYTFINPEDGVITDNIVDLTSEGFYANYNAGLLRAFGQVKENNKNWYRMQITCEGHHLLRTGSVIRLLSDFYPDDGYYLIEQSTHTIRNSDGWRSQLDMRYLGFTQPA